MIEKKKVTCVIPARLRSTRLPNKILSNLVGKTLLERVWNRANECQKFDEVIFAIDSDEAKEKIESFGGSYVMTDPDCPTGTHRLIELVQNSNKASDIWVNWQVDEPFISDEMIDSLLQGIDEKNNVGIWTLKKSLTYDELNNPNVTKVVTDIKGNAIFFSRLPIPFCRDGDFSIKPLASKHIGIYAYSDKALKEIANLPNSPLATSEKLEQLAYLEHGLPIRVYVTSHETLGIDTPEDLKKAVLIIEESKERECLKS